MIAKDLFVDRILETENLTDELVDADAQWLLDWGIAQLDLALQGIDNEESANKQVSALMACMRKINRISGQMKHKNPEDLASDLGELAGLKAEVFGTRVDLESAGFAKLASELQRMPTRQALEFLTSWGSTWIPGLAQNQSY